MENYIEQLTGKSSEYVHELTKQLMLLGKSDQEVKAILADSLPKIIEGQQQGILAKKLLGTPSQYAATFSEATTKKETDQPQSDKPVLMWLDNALLLLGVLAVINGVMTSFSKQSQTYGLITLLVMSAVGGLVFWVLYYFIYRHQEQGQILPLLKRLPITMGAIVLWVAAFTLTMFLPKAINPQIPAIVTILIGLIALVARFFLKKRYNIRPAFAQPQK